MINCFGPAFGYLGYQVHARKFFSALDRKEPVCLVSTNATPPGFVIDPAACSMIERAKAINLADPAICIDYGNNFHRFAGRIRIGFTVFEYTRLAPDWLNGLRQVDVVWTTSRWGADVLALNGLHDRQIGIVPEGIDPTVFHSGRKRSSTHSEVFRFLCVGKWEVRKGQADLLRAWAKAFAPTDSVELLMMCDNPFMPGFSVEKEIAALDLGKTAPIRALRPVATDVEMAETYSNADCFVLPTRAEGWGLPVIEAMACAMPVITGRCTAMTEYAHDGNAYLLDVKCLVPVFDPQFFPVAGESGLWAQFDEEQLIAHLRHVATHRQEAATRGQTAAREMASSWTWDHAAAKALALLTGIRPRT